MPQTSTPWWRDAVLYQIYIRSFADGNADGIGDLAGIRTRLSYVRDLGVDGLCISPWYPSPMKDGGHDVADDTDIEPLFGTLADARALVDEAHALGLKIIVDAASHTADEHQGFAAVQPDRNGDHAGVRADVADMLRFWFDLGLDGLRMNAGSGLAENPDILGEWQAIADRYEGKRMVVGELAVNGPDRPGWDLLTSPLDPIQLRLTIEDTLTSFAAVGAPATWALSNPDETRHLTRYGREYTGIPLTSRWPFPPSDRALGTRRARAALLLVLGLPGSVYLYQGEKLGLWEVEGLADEHIADPAWESSGHTVRGRDGCRVPMPWSGTEPPFGFSDGTPWLPQPPEWRDYTVEAEEGQDTSMLHYYRAALAARLSVANDASAGLTWLETPDGVLAFHRGSFGCLINFSDQPVPVNGPVLISSSPVVDGLLGPDAAAWTSGLPGGDNAAQHTVDEIR